MYRQPINSKPDTVMTEDCTLVPQGTTLRRAKYGENFTSFADVAVLCMLLGRHARPSYSTGGDWFYGLILGDSGKNGVYHRLGLATFTAGQTFTGEPTTVQVD
jgi:hypothetical protein